MLVNIPPKILKFGLAGVINTAVDWALYFAMVHTLLPGNEAIAKLAGSVGGVTSAFALNAGWVFAAAFAMQCNQYQTTFGKLRFIGAKYMQTVLVYTAGMLLNLVVFTAARYVATPELVALLLATACSFIVNFALLNRFVFVR
ncbi:GtrA family protein [Pontibacter fetidus]|uniref:GtrA family protein n=1 Tax=Pontibacter fetidus TaxID=2700082 RepID=A0A6B2H4L3_9BACT|nr:GtrA family protein [Pontibacter fetidus]NDK55267.1 GtrA family protein [Pontibacter fetidus]